MDVIEGVFPEEVVKGLFKTYDAVLDIVCAQSPGQWNVPLDYLIPAPEPVPPVAPSCPSTRLLHEPFLAHDGLDDIAVRDCSDGTSLSYGALEQRIERVSLGCASCSGRESRWRRASAWWRW